MNKESLELKKRIVSLSDDQLLQMVTVDAADYREEALDYAKEELSARGIDPTKPPAAPGEAESADNDKEDQGALEVRGPAGVTCFICGGQTRSGTLVAEKELSIIFADNQEERFVRVMACRRCGQLSLTVDYDQEVER